MTYMAHATLPSIGYAGRPLPEKLGYASGATIAFVGLPEELADLPASADFGKIARRQDWSRPLGNVPFDVIHAFTTSRAELVAGLPRLRRAIQPDGMIWVSWPKKASRMPTDVTEDVIRVRGAAARPRRREGGGHRPGVVGPQARHPRREALSAQGVLGLSRSGRL